MTRLVFDSYAILAYFLDEHGAGRVQQLLDSRSHERWMTAVNVGETFYIAAKRSDLVTAEEMLNDVLDLPVQIVEAGFGMTMEAAQLKARYTLSYADCFAAALAQQLDAPVVTGDEEFRTLERAGVIDVEWLPAKDKRSRH